VQFLEQFDRLAGADFRNFDGGGSFLHGGGLSHSKRRQIRVNQMPNLSLLDSW
jgi:hypothetical protein